MNAVIVTGDRYAQRVDWIGLVDKALDQRSMQVRQGCVVIHGGADGIDSFAGSCCTDDYYLDEVRMPAQWKTHGKAAGPRRNGSMLKVLLILKEHGYSVNVLAFHDDLSGSKGTKDMVNQAVRVGVETWHFTTYNDPVRITEVLT